MSLLGEKKSKHICDVRIKKGQKIIEFHNEKQTKKLLLSNKHTKKTKEKTYRKRAKAQNQTRFQGLKRPAKATRSKIINRG